MVDQSPELLQTVNEIDRLYNLAQEVGLEWVYATLHEEWGLEPELAKQFYDIRKDLNSALSALRAAGLKEFEQSIAAIAKVTDKVLKEDPIGVLYWICVFCCHHVSAASLHYIAAGKFACGDRRY